jgi:hypothetical protein
MSSKSAGRFQTPGALYEAFIKAVVCEVNSAIILVGQATFPNGPDSPSSPEARVLIDSGEWDIREKVPMVACSKQTCKARVGADVERFCFTRNCDSIASHLKDKHKLALEDGWYVRIGSRDSQGAHVTPYLPESADTRVPSIL